MIEKKNLLIDLHIHTCYSDGDYAPNEVLKLVRQSNIGTFAITDHNTVLGVQELLRDYHDEEINFISGIEVDSIINKGELHILGYNINPDSEKLVLATKKLRELAIIRIKLTLKYLGQRFNVHFSDEDLANLFNTVGNIGRPNVAKLCVKYGYAKTFQEAFDRYLAVARDHITREYDGLLPQEVIATILNAGGMPVLAHPYTLRMSSDELDIFTKKLVNYGLKGLEIYHSRQSEAYSQQLLKLVNKYHLLYSGGTDFHGPTAKPRVMIGTGIDNNVKIKRLTIVDAIKK